MELATQSFKYYEVNFDPALWQSTADRSQQLFLGFQEKPIQGAGGSDRI